MIAAIALSASVATLLALVLPLVVDVVAASTASSALKSMLLTIFVTLTTVVEQLVVADGVALVTEQMLVLIVTNLVFAIGTFFGVLKPIGASDAIRSRTSGIGIGSNEK